MITLTVPIWLLLAVTVAVCGLAASLAFFIWRWRQAEKAFGSVTTAIVSHFEKKAPKTDLGWDWLPKR